MSDRLPLALLPTLPADPAIGRGHASPSADDHGIGFGGGGEFRA